MSDTKLQIRLSESELAMVKGLASKHNMTVSEFLRSVINGRFKIVTGDGAPAGGKAPSLFGAAKDDPGDPRFVPDEEEQHHIPDEEER